MYLYLILEDSWIFQMAQDSSVVQRHPMNSADAHSASGLAKSRASSASITSEPSRAKCGASRAEQGVGSARLAHGSARGSWKFFSIHFETIIAKMLHLYATTFHIIK